MVSFIDNQSVNKVIEENIWNYLNFMEYYLTEYVRGALTSIPRYVFYVNGTWSSFMFSIFKNTFYCVKIVNVNPNTKPSTKGIVLVLNESLRPIALIDGISLTAWRTAILSAISTKYLAKSTENISVIGAGIQARYHIKTFLKLFKVNYVFITSKTKISAEMLCNEISKEFNVECIVKDLPEILNKADIVIAATTSKTPVVFGRYLRNNCHIISIGAHEPNSREIDDEVIKKAGKIVVDCKEAVLRETGDVIEPLKEGLISENDIIELHELILGKKVEFKEITLYKSVGFSIPDAITAAYILNKLGILKI